MFRAYRKSKQQTLVGSLCLQFPLSTLLVTCLLRKCWSGDLLRAKHTGINKLQIQVHLEKQWCMYGSPYLHNSLEKLPRSISFFLSGQLQEIDCEIKILVAKLIIFEFITQRPPHRPLY